MSQCPTTGRIDIEQHGNDVDFEGRRYQPLPKRAVDFMHVKPGSRSDRMVTWLEATTVRVSRRAFDGSPAPARIIDALTETCEGFRPFGDARVVLVTEPKIDVFKGIFGSYGTIVGAPHVITVLAAEKTSAAHSHAGYVGEAAVLDATSHGLDSCWVGGFFDPKKAARLVDINENETVVAVIPVGYALSDMSRTERTMSALAHSRNRKAVEEIAPDSETWPQWARAAAECVRIAPSATNRQPWRLRHHDDSIVVSRDNVLETPRVTKSLDCGIAMLHAELGALGAGVSGTWTDLRRDLDVARFTIDAR